MWEVSEGLRNRTRCLGPSDYHQWELFSPMRLLGFRRCFSIIPCSDPLPLTPSRREGEDDVLTLKNMLNTPAGHGIRECQWRVADPLYGIGFFFFGFLGFVGSFGFFI